MKLIVGVSVKSKMAGSGIDPYLFTPNPNELHLVLLEEMPRFIAREFKQSHKSRFKTSDSYYFSYRSMICHSNSSAVVQPRLTPCC